jgi:signal peptidase I/Ni,Fe-hydrogenase III small subunit
MKTNLVLKGVLGVGGALLLGFALLIGVVVQVVGSVDASQTAGCAASTATSMTPVVGTTPGPATPTASQAEASATVNSLSDGTCYPGSQYAAQVVRWAKRMADALYVNPACGRRRGGDCNDTYYTSAFPKAVIAYGQAWCHAHGDCADWANGTYQCVSFVRGAYSQVYPMKYSNNAFGLWATYQNLPGWQEIPAAATADSTQRFLPEPGDVMVFKDVSVGHVAIVMAVQPPQGQKNGWVEFANANSSSAYDRMPLLPNLLVDTSEWAPSGGNYIVWGYIRPRLSFSQNVVRISQLDQTQYATPGEWRLWAYSACSAAAMTEVLNAYGLHVRIHDVLTVEAGLGDITPAGGLQEDVGIARTMQHFGFRTTWGEHWQLSQVVGTANGGQPVIVGWPPDRYAGGHIVVVTGGDLTAGTITIADSSLWNRHVVRMNQFLQWWAGFAAVSTPA